MLIAKEEEKVFALKIYNSKKQGGRYLFFFVNSGKILLELYFFFLRSRQDWVSHWPE